MAPLRRYFLWPSFPMLIESVNNAFSTTDYTTTDMFKSSVESLGPIFSPFLVSLIQSYGTKFY